MTSFARERWRGRLHIARRAAMFLAATVVAVLGLLGLVSKIAWELRGLVGQ